MKRILFVCTGNICRSPTAEGIARSMTETSALRTAFDFDSAGTHGYHAGERPDPRTIAAAAARGYDLRRLVSRQLEIDDFDRFDLLLAMDRDHLRTLRAHCPLDQHHKLALFLSFANGLDRDEVPDPYYGGPSGFDEVLDLCEAGVSALLEHLTQPASVVGLRA